ncbi:MAG: ABC transporter substrate-binding protein [Verrucomicrobia bacterium]|nr:ABC transporter substrate-binding protein [Verrucomicrobiota bacterium]MCH8526014.1 ABC transporter substrate-binding protein [Kiritimatiellia bacterium]
MTFVGCGRSPAPETSAAPLVIGYSDWPGWVAWEIAIQKGWFEEAGVPVKFEWFDYVESMDAFAAGQLDAVTMTNGDALVTGEAGAPSLAILINDFSNGNDMLVAAPGITSVPELAGKRVGVEVGYVCHLLLLKALEAHDMTESDVTLINIPTHDLPQAFAAGDVDAVVAWQPNSSQALQAVAGSTAIFTSADVPGLIYDVLAVSPTSLSERMEDWEKVVQVWYRVVDYILNEDTRDSAIAIMASRVGLTAEAYAEFVDGTQILTLEEAQAAFAVSDELSSIFGSSKIADAFNVANEVYDTPQNVADYIYPAITLGLGL